MKLRTRFAVAFAGVALAASGVLFASASVVIDRAWDARIREQNDLDLDRLESGPERTGSRIREKADLVMEALTRQESLPLLVDAARGDGVAKGDLGKRVEELAGARDIDVIDVVQSHGSDAQVLASAHFRQGFDRPDPSARRRVDEEKTDGLVFVPAGVGTAMRLAWTHTRKFAERELDDLYLVTGVFVDDARRLAELAGENACLDAGADRDVTHGLARDPFRADLSSELRCGTASDYDFYQSTQLEVLPSFDGGGARSVVLSIGRIDPTSEAIRKLRLAFVVLSVALLLLSLPLAAFFARRFATPIADLADGARAIAAGDLDVRVAKPGGRGDEIASLVDAFNRMAGDLKDSRAKLVQSERIAAWREIARRIAHEIKNPLTPIQLAVETTRKAHKTRHADFDEIFEESAQAILEEVESLKKLVKEFSEFARMPEPTLAPTDLNETVRGALKLFTGLPEGIAVETRLDESLPKMMLDRNQISRALLNLIANAADALGDKGRITITTHRVSDARGDSAELHVADDGPGIPEAERETIFTPYFTTKANGTGLGLSIVQRIVTDHGGDIRVAAAPGGGADFTLRLPLPAALSAAALG